MTLKQQLEDALKDAMRSRDEVRKSTLRMALTSIRLAEVSKGEALDDAAVMAILQKEIKTREETISDAQKANRPDLEAESRAEIAVLQCYLPQPFSEQELDQLAREAILESGATTPQQMGQVMKILVPRLQGRATGNQASLAVRKLLG